ncbi:MFS transporter [Nocardia sp. NBC_01009]|uniref:MFS transporter n=1 Tax=Nocardia sp. NBC_01009 TaxID=2975996 RepID=UPI0038701737|nr:MFS transporter [Nocardia sp. NBC_01009]
MRHTRLAVFGIFGLHGFAFSTWAVQIPSAQASTGMSTAQLGTLLVVLGAAARVGMQLSGPLVGRYGSARTAVVGNAGIAGSISVPLLATNAVTLAAGLALLGFTLGINEVAMNAQAVIVEQRYGRPIMSAFHAVYSVGNVVGAAAGATTLALEWSPGAIAVGASGICLMTAGSAARVLWTRQTRAEESATTSPRRSRSETPSSAQRHRRIVTLGVLAFLFLLAEGVAADWSIVHSAEHLGISGWYAALTYASFVVSMTFGRFVADRATARHGPVRVVRMGCVVAAVGIAVVIGSPMLVLTIIGWGLFGLGLAGTVPQVFSAAGNTAGSTATDLSRVVGMGYTGILAGPTIIGWLTEFVPLNATLLVPLAAVAVCLLAAGNVGR